MKELFNYIGCIIGLIIGGIGLTLLAALIILLSPLLALIVVAID